MALSRTARILIGVLLLAAAGFFWLNFFQQNKTVETSPTPVPAVTPASTQAPGTPAPLAGTPSGAPTGSPSGVANGIVTTPDESTAEDGIASTGAPVATTPEGQTQAPTGTAAPVVVTDPPAVVLRDLVVEQLPFLVTEPPQVAEEDADDDADDAGRGLMATRANVNPFSPIIVQAPPAAQQPIAAAPTPDEIDEPQIVVVNGGPEPTGATDGGATSGTTTVARAPVTAPAPRAVAPASSRTGELPRPIPTGTLSAVPDILRDARTQPTAAAGPANLGTVAAIVVPDENQGAELPYASSEGQVTAATAPEPIGPGHVQEAPKPSTPTLPVAVGADPLSRYLRDNNVRFTGQVLGPLSVGVFRSNLYQQPAVVLLGQTLPDSEILLSDLRGYEARFTLGDNSQVLSLDTRR